jgi:chromosome segregation ATPase
MRLDFIGLAIQGKKIGFEKVIGMIDEMVASLKTEQNDDNDKKEYCAAQFDQSDDKKKSLERTVSDLETSIADAKDGIARAQEEIAALEKGIKALDKSVADATEQRKEENEDFTELMASDSAAKEILGFAKNRLNKFYNPKLYKAPPKRELTDEDRATLAAGGTLAPTAAPGGIAGTGIGLAQTGAAPPPPPEANLAYKKSGESSNGVIAMIDLIVADVDKEIQTMEVDEKDAQQDYEAFMEDASTKRAQDSKSITDKEAAKAETETELQTNTDDKKSKTIEAMETAKYIGGLHEECDWLLKYYDERTAARTGEIDALGKAKAVLSGADYSFVQTGSVHLRR